MKEFYSCPLINAMYINFNGRLDNEKAITICCEPIEDRPGISFATDVETTLSNFIDARLRLINEGYTSDEEYSLGCRKCARYQKKEWAVSQQILYVNLSMYPSPCQCKCFYCKVHSESQAIADPLIKERYEHLFDLIDYAKRTGVIAPNAAWQISCGEIAIHPYKNRIMDLIRGQRVTFYTNCFIYDEQIAENLRVNSGSAINLSIDAGTPETWMKVKGVDNFEDVMMNLTQYYVAGNKPGQITLKYIVFPGINDSEEDYISVIEIMKVLKVKHLTISRDTRDKYVSSPEKVEELMYAAARLVYKCYINDISMDMFTYTKEEQARIVEVVNDFLDERAN